MTGYQPITTYYTDFSYAEKYGEYGINQLFNEVFATLSKDPDFYYKELTELVMVLNWKIWEHYETNEELAKLYNDLWAKLDFWVQDHLNDEHQKYFYRTTD